MRLLLPFITALLLTAAAARAQPLLRAGTSDLAVHVSPDIEGAVGDMIFADASYGRFLRDRLLAKATLSYAVLEDVAGEDSDYRMRELGLAAEYHFPLGGRLARMAAYLGAGLGWRHSQFHNLKESALVYGPRLGFEFFLADNVALDLEVTYKLSSAPVFINDFVAEDSDIDSAVGFRVRF